MNIKNSIVIALLLITCVTYAQTKKWGLKESVDYALENNITIKQSELDLESVEIDKSDAIGNFLPTVNVSASHSWNIGLNQNITTGLLENQTTQFTSARLSVGVTIFGGLQNLNRLRRSDLNILANQYRLDDMKDDISLAVANSYLTILSNRETLNVQRSQYALTQQDLSRTQELVNSGVVPKGDLLEIEATAATQEQQIINSENALRLSKLSLAQLLLIQDYENFDIADEDYMIPTSTVLTNSPKVIYEKALDFRNDIKLSQTNVELAEKDLEITKGRLYPTLSAFYGYDTRASYSDIITGFEPNLTDPTTEIGFVEGSGDVVVRDNFSAITGPASPIFDQFSSNDGHSFGLSLNIPILNGFTVKNSIKRSKIFLERTKLQFEQDKLTLESTINQVWNDARNALKSYEAAEKTVEARRTAYDYSRERFNVGLMNSFDFSQAQGRLDNAEAELIRAKYDYIFRLKVLEFYFGIPLDEM